MIKKTLLLLLFVSSAVTTVAVAQVDVRNKIETGGSSDCGDPNAITLSPKKKKKKKSGSKISIEDLKKASDRKDNIRYRKKRGPAGKCKKAAVKKKESCEEEDKVQKMLDKKRKKNKKK